jgi:precorrin-6Y C5,15-methyltransferase (decarboxylating)
MSSSVTVVGVGADGWPGLGPAARAAVWAADVLVGGSRHLDLVPAEVAAERRPWPRPLVEGLPDLLRRYEGLRLVVLASGDPYLSGVATNLVALLGSERLDVIPAVSSATLARARMGWSAESTDVLTLVGRDHDVVRRYLTPGRRLVVLSSDGTTPRTVASTLQHAGFGSSLVTVLSDLGSEDERRVSAVASSWGVREAPPLNVVCVDVVGGPVATALPTTPGLPDSSFENDGQLTKRDVRASVLSRLAPLPGQLLWDVGAGAGSVSIEWMRTAPRCDAVAVESHPARVARIAGNARRLGVPGLTVVEGRAPDALAGLAAPDAVFVGGGASRAGVLEACWSALRAGGRLVVSSVTFETETVLVGWRRRVGGELVRLSVEVAGPVGTFTGWSPGRPVVLWSVTKPHEEPA